jgi:hypothetical protein
MSVKGSRSWAELASNCKENDPDMVSAPHGGYGTLRGITEKRLACGEQARAVHC